MPMDPMISSTQKKHRLSGVTSNNSERSRSGELAFYGSSKGKGNNYKINAHLSGCGANQKERNQRDE
jgi:hypothetical protein